MKYQASGAIHKIFETEEKGSRGFMVREFVLDMDSKYPQMVKFQVTQEKCAELDQHEVGEAVIVHFNLRGREWDPGDGREPRYFNTLNAWKIERSGSSMPESSFGDDSDIPF